MTRLKKEDFLFRRPGMIGEEKFRQYAVFVPLIEYKETTYLLFEKRSKKLRRHPGEICFPGGKLELGETLQECAIRETMEELEITSSQIELIGPGDVYISPFNVMIYPFLGRIKDYKDTFGKDEVEEIIKIPFDFFKSHQPQQFETKVIHEPPKDFPYEWIPGGTKYPWAKGSYDLLFYSYENWIIWGMTAQIVKSIVELMAEYDILPQ